MEPQRTQRFSLCPPKEFPSEEITEKVKTVKVMKRIYGAHDDPIEKSWVIELGYRLISERLRDQTKRLIM